MTHRTIAITMPITISYAWPLHCRKNCCTHTCLACCALRAAVQRTRLTLYGARGILIAECSTTRRLVAHLPCCVTVSCGIPVVVLTRVCFVFKWLLTSIFSWKSWFIWWDILPAASSTDLDLFSIPERCWVATLSNNPSRVNSSKLLSSCCKYGKRCFV